MLKIGETGNSVIVEFEYGLDDRGSISDRGSTLCGQTGCGVHPVPYAVGTRILSPGGEAWLGRDVLHPHLVPSLRVGAVPRLPQNSFMACSGTTFLYFMYRAY
jgi:hypothetical protein